MSTRRGVTEHWYTDDQFERQLGDPAQERIIHARWRTFGDAIDRVRRTTGGRALRVLDAGCGDGINLVGLRRVLSENPQPWELFALDSSAVRVARAAVPARAGKRILLGSVTTLPLQSASLDIVICNQVIEHVPGPEVAIDEIARVLRPGGVAVIGVPNEGCLLAQLRNHVFQRSILTATDHVNFFTRPSLLRLLGGHGFDVAEIRTEGFFPPHMRLLTLARSSRMGRAALEVARRMLPSQAGGLLAIAVRGGAA